MRDDVRGGVVLPGDDVMKTMLKLLATAALGVAAMTGVQASAQELVTNGGFETGDLAGFTQIGNTSLAGVDGFKPASGNYAAYFGAEGLLGGITQDLATVIGTSYTIQFDLAQEDGNGPEEYRIDFGDTNLTDVASGPAFDYTHFSYTATATSAITTLALQFRNDPNYYYLDNVSVTPNAAVPEPATWAMMVMGFGMVGFGLRQRRRATVRFA